ncbi:MAG: BlaI/MecI/CopY family transcriptional regulator [Bacteroidales bacterium]|nr:BlaI/MecI/CopY family transcriptional regulator [Bacteroidales bacterium]
MSLKSKYNPTESELEILQLLWKNGPSTVRFINEKQNEVKAVGYTTTLKIMQIMAEKGTLDVNKESRQHIYTPALDEDETKGKLLDGFLKKTFSGSAMKMVMQALGNHKPSKEELDEIKNLIKEIENKSKK